MQKNKAKQETIDSPTLADFAALDLGDKFTIKEKKFIYFYTMPGPDFMSQTRAAVKAGYAKKNAFRLGYQIRRKTHIETAIKNILNSYVSASIEEMYQRAMLALDSRAFFSLADYVKKKTVSIKVGKDEYEDIEVEVFKDLSELTPEQLQAVDGIDYRGVHGARVLVMADRTKIQTDIINMRNKMVGAINENEFDIEATADIIKGELSVKIAARKEKEELSRLANYIKPPEVKSIEEL